MRASEAVYEQTAVARSDLRPALRLDLYPQAHIAAESFHRAHQLTTPGGGVFRQISAMPKRERVCHARQPRWAAHFRHQHGGVRFVILPRLDHVFRRDGESAATLRVEQTASSARIMNPSKKSTHMSHWPVRAPVCR